jgi:hypothetical protein
MADFSWHTASYTTTAILEHMASVHLLYLKCWQPKAVRFRIIRWLLTLQTTVGMAVIDCESFASCLECAAVRNWSQCFLVNMEVPKQHVLETNTINCHKMSIKYSSHLGLTSGIWTVDWLLVTTQCHCHTTDLNTTRSTTVETVRSEIVIVNVTVVPHTTVNNKIKRNHSLFLALPSYLKYTSTFCRPLRPLSRN